MIHIPLLKWACTSIRREDMFMKSKCKWLFLDFLMLGVLSLILNMLNIRICPFYRLFKIPCPGCGLTRGFLALLKLDILKSLSYNVLCIPILVIFGIYLLFIIFNKEKILMNWLNKYKVLLIVVCLLVLIIVFIINYNNPLLY